MSASSVGSFLIALSIATGCGAVERGPAPATYLDVSDAPVVQGRIVDAAGNGIADAQVLLAPGRGWSRVDQGDFDRCALTAEMSTLTDTDGHFRIAAPPPGALRVVVRKRGFAELDWNYGLVVTPGSHLDLGEFALTRAAVVHGLVVDEDGQAVAGAEVYRTWAEGGMSWIALDLVLARGDDEGRFTLDVLPVGNMWGGPEHGLGARAPGYYDLQFHLRVPVSGEPARWREDDEGDEWREDELVLSLTSGPTIHGHVRALDGRSDAPWVLVARSEIDVGRITRFYANAPIDWGRARQYGGPDPFSWRILPVSKDGTFTAGAFARPGPEVRPLYEEYVIRGVWLTPIESWEPWVVPAGATVLVDDFENDARIELEVLPPARAELRVVDAESGRPLEELAVSVAPAPWMPKPLASTHYPDGRVEVEGRARALNLWIAAPGHLPAYSADLPVVPGETVDLGVVELVPAAQISVRVIDAITGAPIVGAEVSTGEAYPDGQFHDTSFEAPDFRRALTDAEGRARLNYAGSTTVDVWTAAGYGPIWPPDWNELDEMNQVIALRPARRANLLVTDAVGAPVPGLPVLVDNEDVPTRFTDRDGRLRGIDDPRELRVLVPGAWHDDSAARSTCKWVGPERGPEPVPGVDREIALRLPPLLPIEVIVLDSGHPPAGALWGLAAWESHLGLVDARGQLLGLERAPPGPLRLSVWRPETGKAEPVALEIAAGVERLVVDLARPADE